MSWNYRNFPSRQVVAEKYKARIRNTIISHYRYRVYTNIVKAFFAIHWFTCACTDCVNQFDKYWFTDCEPSS